MAFLMIGLCKSMVRRCSSDLETNLSDGASRSSRTTISGEGSALRHPVAPWDGNIYLHYMNGEKWPHFHKGKWRQVKKNRPMGRI